MIAADFTARHPERVKTLTLFAPAGLRLLNTGDSVLVSLMTTPVIGIWLWRIVARGFYFPVLGIFGDADDTISLESAALLADLILRAWVEIISGGTHHLNTHRWRDVRDIMLSFLHNKVAMRLPADVQVE